MDLSCPDSLKQGFSDMDNDRITCSDAGDQVSARCRLLSLQPAGFEAVEAVEVDKVGAAQATDDREPTSVGS